MLRSLLLGWVLALVLGSCADSGKPFHVVKANNPEYVPNSRFARGEDLRSPKFNALKEKYQLDTIFHGETDEFKRILLIRHWIHRTIPIDNYGPYFGDQSAESVLDQAAKGHGFHCGHYMLVQDAILNGYGYVTRCVLADVGFPVDLLAGEGHHAVNEVWLNQYHKWFLTDAKYDYHFEKNGIPLSALDVRDEYLKNQAADIQLMKGPERVPTDNFPELKNRSKALFARIYTWLSWAKYLDRYTDWPNCPSDTLFMYDDAYFRTHTWLYNGKPHWAYHTPFLTLVENRKEIEWTPNTILATTQIRTGDSLYIQLRSSTPNLRSYQVKMLPDSAWKDVSDQIELKLSDLPGKELVFRTINLASVPGVEYHLKWERD